MALAITKPTVGGSDGSWGQVTNDALDAIVARVNALGIPVIAGPTNPGLTEAGLWIDTSGGNIKLWFENGAP